MYCLSVGLERTVLAFAKGTWCSDFFLRVCQFTTTLTRNVVCALGFCLAAPRMACMEETGDISTPLDICACW